MVTRYFMRHSVIRKVKPIYSTTEPKVTTVNQTLYFASRMPAIISTSTSVGRMLNTM